MVLRLGPNNDCHLLTICMYVGIGLMELVTEPDMKSGLEAASFVKELRLLLRKLETCDGNIQGLTSFDVSCHMICIMSHDIYQNSML